MANGKINLKVKSQRVALLDENRYLTRVSRYSTIPSDQVIAYAAQSANVPASAITQAALAIRDAISYFVLNGHHVDLGKFGNIGIGLKAKSAVTKEEISANLVEKIRVRYIPSAQIKALVDKVELINQ